jgi:rhamnose transport system permease protein
VSSADSVAVPAPRERRSRRELVDAVVRVRELGLIVVLALLIGVTAAFEPRFIEADSLRNLVRNATILGLLAVGQTLVLVTRNLDLSVGSVLGLSAFMTGDVLASNPGLPIPIVFALGILLGTGAGIVNGTLVAYGRIPALVATLGTLWIFRGLAFVWTGGSQVNAENLPGGFLSIGTGTVAGVPTIALFTIVVLVAVGFGLRNYRAGRELYAIGSNPDAARLAGIRHQRRVFGAFIASGSLAELAGVLFTARFATVDATAGTGLELQVIAAAVIGGVAIFGGSGSVWGAALGAVVLTTITSALIVLQVPAFWQQAVVGALLLTAIALDRFINVRVTERLRRRSARRTEAVAEAVGPPEPSPAGASGEGGSS